MANEFVARNGINIGTSTNTAITSDGTSIYIKSGGNTYLNTANSAYVSSTGTINASGVGGFTSATYVAGARNPIWRFGNADTYGLSYFQGTAGDSSQDTIGFHFGTATAPGSPFRMRGDGLFIATIFSGAGTYLTGTATSLSIGGNAATATNVAYSGLTGTVPTWNQNTTGNATTATSVYTTYTGTNEGNVVYANIADNDFFRIRVGGSATNAGWAEIATADDGNEPIYVRQYTGVFTTVTRTATLLDGSGNTTFPGTVTGTNFSGNWNGYTYSASSGANTMVQRNASGYIENNYFYTGGGGSERNATGMSYFAGFNSSDYYIRSYTPAAVASAIGLGSYLPLAGGTITGNIIAGNYGIGNVGLYSPTNYQNIFSMGTSYVPSADGTTLSNMYGLAWTHPNIGGQSKAGLSHQMLVVEAGVTKTAIGTGIWTSGGVSATSFSGAGTGLTGTAASLSVNYATSAGSAGSVAWTSVTGRPTTVSSFTNDSGYTTNTGTVTGTGLSNYITKWSSTTAITYSSAIYDDSSQAGIESPIIRLSSSQIFIGLSGSSTTIIGDYDGGGTTAIVQVSATLRVTRDVIAYYSSDKRLKDNIKKISDPLNKISKIGGYEFDWNGNQDTYIGHDIGVIAQEIEGVLPELVTTRVDGYKAVKYEKIVALLIEGIKDQQKLIENQQKQIDSLLNK